MTKHITEHEGKKYLKLIRSASNTEEYICVDVYCVLKAFNVTCPARQHAIKKLLCCGSRGKGGELQDLLGVEAAVSRAIELQKERDFEKEQESLPKKQFDSNLVIGKEIAEALNQHKM